MEYVEALERYIAYCQIAECNVPRYYRWEASGEALHKWLEVPEDMQEKIEALSDQYKHPDFSWDIPGTGGRPPKREEVEQ